MKPIRFAVLVCVPLALLAGAPLAAQPGYWGRPWGGWGWPRSPFPDYPVPDSRDSREGKVRSAQFLADSPAVAALGRGRIAVSSEPGIMGESRTNATYEAAVVDALAKAGYDTGARAGDHEQVAELAITHTLVSPEEPPHKPVSGQVDLGVGTLGTYMGVGVHVDARRPRKALVATRLAARIRDKATNTLLWEGYSTIVTREGSKRWTTQTIATRLASELFKGFPGKS